MGIDHVGCGWGVLEINFRRLADMDEEIMHSLVSSVCMHAGGQMENNERPHPF
jgi:hypothetical protein